MFWESKKIGPFRGRGRVLGLDDSYPERPASPGHGDARKRAPYVAIPRQYFDSEDPLWNDGSEFDRRSAWIDLYRRAAWRDGLFRTAFGADNLRRGEFVASLRYLAECWTWSKSGVERFLKKLEKAGRIARQRMGQHGAIYLIVNYDGMADTVTLIGTEPETPAEPPQGRVRDAAGTSEGQRSSTLGSSSSSKTQTSEHAPARLRENAELLLAECYPDIIRRANVRRQLEETLTEDGTRFEKDERVRAFNVDHLEQICGIVRRNPPLKRDASIRFVLVKLRDSFETRRIEVEAQRERENAVRRAQLEKERRDSEAEQQRRVDAERWAKESRMADDWIAAHPEEAAAMEERIRRDSRLPMSPGSMMLRSLLHAEVLVLLSADQGAA